MYTPAVPRYMNEELIFVPVFEMHPSLSDEPSCSVGRISIC
jgi:hypothetical protein